MTQLVLALDEPDAGDEPCGLDDLRCFHAGVQTRETHGDGDLGSHRGRHRARQSDAETGHVEYASLHAATAKADLGRKMHGLACKGSTAAQGEQQLLYAASHQHGLIRTLPEHHASQAGVAQIIPGPHEPKDRQHAYTGGAAKLLNERSTALDATAAGVVNQRNVALSRESRRGFIEVSGDVEVPTPVAQSDAVTFRESRIRGDEEHGRSTRGERVGRRPLPGHRCRFDGAGRRSRFAACPRSRLHGAKQSRHAHRLEQQIDGPKVKARTQRRRQNVLGGRRHADDRRETLRASQLLEHDGRLAFLDRHAHQHDRRLEPPREIVTQRRGVRVAETRKAIGDERLLQGVVTRTLRRHEQTHRSAASLTRLGSQRLAKYRFLVSAEKSIAHDGSDAETLTRIWGGDAAQGLEHALGVLKPVLGLQGQRFVDHRRNVRADVGALPVQWGNLCASVARKGFLAVAGVKQRSAREHLVKNNAQAENVGPPVQRCACLLLGSQVAHGADGIGAAGMGARRRMRPPRNRSDAPVR